MHTSLRLLTVSVALAATAGASVTNGDFTANLTDWSTLGDVGIRDGAAFLTTAATSGDDDLGTPFNFSGQEPVFASTIEDTLSFPAGSLDPDVDGGVFAQEGSLLYRNLSLQAGDVLSFTYNFFSNDAANDYAFVLFDALRLEVTDLPRFATTDYGYAFTTGTQTFTSAPAAETRVVSLAIGIVETTDFSGTSALLVDNVSVTAIPEPSSFAALAGLATLGLAASRRRRA